MCLATVYKTREPENVILQFVSKLEVEGNTIILTDIMGELRKVQGKIQMVDFANNIVKIEEVEE